MSSPSADSMEVFILGPPSADVSTSSSEFHIEVSDQCPDLPASPREPTTDYPDTSAMSAIIDWQHIWEAADRSCVESTLSLNLKGIPAILQQLDLQASGGTSDAVETSPQSPHLDLCPTHSDGDDLVDIGQHFRNLCIALNRRDGTGQTVAHIREDFHVISRQLEDWLVATVSLPSPPQGHTERLKERIRTLEQEEQDLSARVFSLEQDLKTANESAEAWKAEARNVQNMQEVAVTAFQRCNALEMENEQLKQAMNAFAEGSTSNTVKELRHIIGDLTRELAMYKKREKILQDKEIQMRAKENASIIEGMRKQTEDLKRRKSQRHALSIKNIF
ncbi:hypothetical protein BXZ70DRAFT_274344 [Cristinia sonorae]|uniref:Uncharacterized protein n=1 Tax=Cristinia sonorae TaxID=1940300 RepID=A0A8K0UYK9_9AGAR|nr:hypothetical protein BXZ70DRAFT_274344 [Cristinia sonorae]